ncbi:hypothetical protein C8J57DRAFT_1520652 [Mycena rebaudengoi]|nr:hypothetical protein C8J57DRAFT_1520652 [Mycena rebaudengoi]
MASKFVNNSWEASKTETLRSAVQTPAASPPLLVYVLCSARPSPHPLRSQMHTNFSFLNVDRARHAMLVSAEEIAAFEDAIAYIAVRDDIATCGRGERNLRILEHGVPVKPPARQYKNVAEPVIGQRVGSPTTRGPSSATRPRRRPCRTRDSRTWWKAPKRLFMSIFSDKCGTNWREYADLDMRPECYCRRQRTPLAPSVSKRAKVGAQTSAHSTPRRKRLSPLKFVVSRAAKVLKFKQCEFRVHAAFCSGGPRIRRFVGMLERRDPEFVSVVPTGGAKKIPPGGIAPAIDSYLHVRRAGAGRMFCSTMLSLAIF